MRPIRPGEAARWDELVRARHYLGLGQLVGETLKYVAEADGEWLALVGWASAAFKCGSRDRWIGWSEEQQNRRRRFVVNNARFLLLPEEWVPNLASRVLALNTRRLSEDWQAIFGHPVLLAETFVDPERFNGGCYRAAGWLEVGRSRGFGRSAGRYYYHGKGKAVWLRPLHRRAQRWLSAPFDVPVIQRWGGRGMAPVLADLNALKLTGRDGLFARLRELPEVRKARGIRHDLVSILAVAVAAVVTGARSFLAIGEWSQDLSPEMRRRLHCRVHPETGELQSPTESTIRRTLQKVDGDALDRIVNDWIATKCKPNTRAAIAVDGKTLRGAVGPDGRRVHVFAALLHAEGVVIAQRQIPDKTNEIPEFRPLLEPLDLHGKVVTADALHAQVGHARFVVEEKGGNYVFTVKGNQKGLLEAIQTLDDSSFSPAFRQTEKGHGRIEIRTIQVSTALQGYVDFPHAAQVFRIHRKTTYTKTGKVTEEDAYGVTSLTPEEGPPDLLLALVRRHWHIENKLHWVRDVTYGEDLSQVRTGNAPRVMATLRNVSIGLLRLIGFASTPTGNRYYAKRSAEAIALLGV